MKYTENNLNYEVSKSSATVISTNVTASSGVFTANTTNTANLGIKSQPSFDPKRITVKPGQRIFVRARGKRK
jgi:plastocyanin